MKRFVIALIFALLGIFSLQAAEVTGRVVDANGNVMEFVNVALKMADRDEIVSGGITDLQGNFTLESLPAGTYRLEISFVGYVPYSQTVEVQRLNQTINLKEIKLTEDSQMLGEVEVVSQGAAMRFDIDKKVFNVDQNVAAAGASASEVLENIPSIEVDNDGNISLRSNSSVEVWINGKPSGLDEENRAQFLEQLPAGSIESIEVITNPSAKFSPEGTAGIINIVLKKDRRSGFFGSASAGLDYQIVDKVGGNASVNFNYSSSKIDFSLNAGFRQRNGGGKGYTDRWSLHDGDTTSLMHQDNSDARKSWGLFGRAGLDWHIDDKNTLGISGMINSNNGTNWAVIDYNTERYGTVIDTAIYHHRTDSKNKRLSYDVELDYLHELDTKGSEIRSSLSYSRSSRDQNSDYNQTVDRGWASAYQQFQYNGFVRQRAEFKTDYVQKIRDNMKVEAGVSVNWLDRFSNSYTNDLKTSDTLQSAYNDYTYREWIAAAYATYGAKFGGFSFSVGLRGEYTNTQVGTRDSASVDYITSQRDYFQVYPTAYLSYAFPNNHELQLNYTRRVNRPRGRQLSAYRNVSDSTNISYGNPDLMPEFANALELNYLKSWEQHTLSASLYYRYSTNVVQRVQFESPGRAGVMEETYDNVASRQSVGLELVAKNNFTKWLNTTLTGNVFYEKMSAIDYNGMHLQDASQGFSWNIRLMANFLFTKTFTGQLTAAYFSPHVIAQGKTKDFYSIDLGLRKSFLDRTLNLSFTVRDLLNSRGWKKLTWGDSFYQDFERQPAGQRFTLSLTYNFGNMKGKKRDSDRQRSDSNSDFSGGEDFE